MAETREVEIYDHEIQPIVGSSMITGVSYDPSAGDLVVQTTRGHYGYGLVQPDVYDEFLDSDSKGRFYNQQLKGKYPPFKVHVLESFG